MGGDEALIAIGVGCRRNCPAEEIVTLVNAAMLALPAGSTPGGLFTIEDKRGEAGLVEAARDLGLPLTFLDRAVLRLVAGQAESCSRRVEDLYGLPSIAETAALAGAGTNAILLVARRSTPRATCAIAGPGKHVC